MANLLPPYQPINCPATFDFELLLQESTEAESVLLSANEEGTASEGCAALAKEDPVASELKKGMLELNNGQEKRKASKPLSRGHKRRRQHREDAFDANGYVPRSEALDKHVRCAKPVTAVVDFATFSATSGAYSAKLTAIPSPTNKHAVSGLLADGFKLLQWDGL